MPEEVIYVLLFISGTALGSFLNVLALRYSDKHGFSRAFSGRSKCPHCEQPLSWSELIPLLSFAIQGRKCRSCAKPISWMYPAVELLSGIIAVGMPLYLGFGVPALIWAAVFWTLLLISAIDLRLKLIPNKLVFLLLLLGAALVWHKYAAGYSNEFASSQGVSFIGHYYLTFRIGKEILLNHLWSVAFGLALFGGVYLFTKGKAMGLGDVKLAGALGALLVLPDMVLAMALAFITGSVIGLILMALGDLKFKSKVPFGPFMALGVTLVFFFGYDIVDAYFNLFGLL